MPTFDETLFAPDGALASAIEGYTVRQGQLELSQAIVDNLSRNGVLLAEAGTGTGKTFAYLLPALSGGGKVLISTATKNLQEQIFEHALPLIRKVLRSSAKVALLKGRRNYYCHYHHEKWLQKPAQDSREKYARAEIALFVRKTKDGDLVGLTNIAENDPLIQNITSSVDSCLGRDCDFYEQCFLQQARQHAKEADVIIVNHHLLLADFAIRSEGFAEILPEVDAFIIDEAHHLPNTAINFLGIRLSVRQLQTLVSDVKVAQLEEAPDNIDLANFLPKLSKTIQDCILTIAVKKETRFSGETLTDADIFWQALQTLAQHIERLLHYLQQVQARGKLLAHVCERSAGILNILDHFFTQYNSRESGSSVLVTDAASEEGFSYDKTKFGDSTHAIWLDMNPYGFMLSSVPVNAAASFSTWIKQSQASWTFLSATLAVEGKFDHFARQLGLSDYAQITMQSPFDYRKQALLYHPERLPDTKSKHYTPALMQAILPVLKLSNGRAFLLFTSYRAMHEAECWLQKHPFQLYVQGKAPKSQLLQDFRRAKRGVLLATASFWEGVDVRGGALVCVVIDKLPFSRPDDPVTKMRHKLLIDNQLSPFIHDSLPQAVIALKQGVGRLIRGEADYGVLVIGDPRLRQRAYGRVFIESLPPMSKTTKLSVVKRFFAFHEGERNGTNKG